MFYDRKKYKNFAKIQLKKRWGVPILIVIVSAVITYIFDIPALVNLVKSDSFQAILTSGFSSYEDLAALSTASATSEVMSIIQMIVDAILTMAGINVYLNMSRSPEPVSFSLFIESLNNWYKAVLAVILQFVFVFLWSLLLFIPGIIKAISYSQMYYLLNEYKNLTVSKAMKISMIITKGYKGSLFVTYLSFLGWMILACIPAGLGFLFLEPYMHMTFVNAYHAMLKDALETGKIKIEDLQ